MRWLRLETVLSVEGSSASPTLCQISTVLLPPLTDFSAGNSRNIGVRVGRSVTERRLERMDHISKLDMCSHKAGTGVRDQGACLFCEGPGLYYLFTCPQVGLQV